MFDGSTMKGIRGATAAFAARFDPALVTAGDAQKIVADAAAVENMAATIKALAAKRVADTDLWRGEGDLTPAHQLARQSGTSVTKAKEALETAARLGELPELDAATRRGELSPSQAAPIADAATKNPKAESRLIKKAKGSSLGELMTSAPAPRPRPSPTPMLATAPSTPRATCAGGAPRTGRAS